MFWPEYILNTKRTGSDEAVKTGCGDKDDDPELEEDTENEVEEGKKEVGQRRKLLLQGRAPIHTVKR